ARESKIEFGLFHLRFDGDHRGLSLEIRLHRIIVLLLTDRIAFRQRRKAFYVELGLALFRLSLGKLTFGLIQRRSKWARVNFEQQVAFFYRIAFAIILRDQIARNL